MIKILIDGRTIRPNPAGVGYTVIRLIQELCKYKDLQLIIFIRKGIKAVPNFNDAIIHETDFDYEFVGTKRFIFEQVFLPKIINYYQPHILHLMDSFGLPFLINRKLKVITTLHDLIPLTKYKELMTNFGHFLYKLSINHTLNNSDKIICVSYFTLKDLKRFFPNIPEVRTAVIYNGIDQPEPLNKKQQESTIKKYLINKKYFLYLGGFSPRKNVLSICKAFYNLSVKIKNNYQLVISGRFSSNPDIQKNLKTIKLFINSHQLGNKIIITSYLPKKEKLALLKRASIFLYLSLYEGFGLPVLEALSNEIPVLTSKDGAMKEIAKDFALYADPTDPASISKKITELVNNYHHYKNLAKLAKKKLIPKFSWVETGKKYYNLYRSLV